MAYYPQRFRRYRRRFKRAYGRARNYVRYIQPRGRRRRSGGAGINLGYSHRKMLAGAILMLVGIMMFPKFRDWVAETWVNLKLPIK